MSITKHSDDDIFSLNSPEHYTSEGINLDNTALKDLFNFSIEDISSMASRLQFLLSYSSALKFDYVPIRNFYTHLPFFEYLRNLPFSIVFSSKDTDSFDYDISNEFYNDNNISIIIKNLGSVPIDKNCKSKCIEIELIRLIYMISIYFSIPEEHISLNFSNFELFNKLPQILSQYEGTNIYAYLIQLSISLAYDFPEFSTFFIQQTYGDPFCRILSYPEMTPLISILIYNISADYSNYIIKEQPSLFSLLFSNPGYYTYLPLMNIIRFSTWNMNLDMLILMLSFLISVSLGFSIHHFVRFPNGLPLNVDSVCYSISVNHPPQTPIFIKCDHKTPIFFRNNIIFSSEQELYALSESEIDIDDFTNTRKLSLWTIYYFFKKLNESDQILYSIIGKEFSKLVISLIQSDDHFEVTLGLYLFAKIECIKDKKKINDITSYIFQKDLDSDKAHRTILDKIFTFCQTDDMMICSLAFLVLQNALPVCTNLKFFVSKNNIPSICKLTLENGPIYAKHASLSFICSLNYYSNLLDIPNFVDDKFLKLIFEQLGSYDDDITYLILELIDDLLKSSLPSHLHEKIKELLLDDETHDLIEELYFENTHPNINYIVSCFHNWYLEFYKSDV